MADHAQSPEELPVSENPVRATNQLPLQQMHYSGEINGLQAEMQLDLNYENKLEKAIEAVFTFPLPSKAVVLGVEMQIGDKVVEAELRKRSAAKKEYDDALAHGDSASLAEQEREDVFTMSVGGIQPGEKASVRIKYQQSVDWQNSGGRFRIPLAVAPAFVPGLPVGESRGKGWSPDTDLVPDASRLTPLLTDQVNYSASVDIRLRPGFEAKVSCPSHPVLLSSQELANGEEQHITLENLRPDRDIIVNYQTRERRPTLKADRSTWESPQGNREDFMLLQLTPPLEQQSKDRDVILCLDCSGSMSGAGIEGLKKVVEKSLERFLDEHAGSNIRVGIVAFSNDSRTLVPLSPIGEAHRSAIAELRASGGTEAGKALDHCMKQFGEGGSGRERSILLVSDGQTYSRDFRAVEGVRIYSVGIGAAIGDEFLTDVAKRTDGLPYWVRSGEDYDTVATELVGRTSGPEIRDVKIRGVDAEQVVGLQSLFANHPATFALKLPVDQEGPLYVYGTDRSGVECAWMVNPKEYAPQGDLARRAWARLMLKEDLSPERLENVSLEHGILSSHTAFVGVISREVAGQTPERIDIPVLLPEGWDYEAFSPMMKAGRVAMRGLSAGSFASLASLDCFGLSSLDDTREYGLVADSIEEFDSGIFDPVHPEPKVVEDARNLLSEVQRSGLNFEVAKLASDLQAELKQLDLNGFSSLSELEKAELYLVLVQCARQGIQVDIPESVRARPQGREAEESWREASRIAGINIQL